MLKKIGKFPKIDGQLGWYETSPYKGCINSDSINGELYFDYVVVGAGFTGVAAARRLAEINPHSTIALVDALKIGEGASGRNSGHLVDIPKVPGNFSDDINSVKTGYDLNIKALSLLKVIVDRHNLSVDWDECGHYLVSATEKTYKDLSAYERLANELNVGVTPLDRAGLTKRLGTSYYTKGLHVVGNVMANPASLIMGTASVLPDNVTIFEEAPLRKSELSDVKRLMFDRGEIKTKKILFATNAFNDVMPIPKFRLAPMVTYASLTRPLKGSELDTFSQVKGHGLRSAHAAGTSQRFTNDNRIMIRNCFKADLADSQSSFNQAVNAHRNSFEDRYPSLKAVEFEYSWAGNICITLNGESQFSHSGDGVYSVAGMNGAGILRGTYLGYYMAEYMSGIESQELDFIKNKNNPSLVPPDPFRKVGATMRLCYESYSAGPEI